MKNFSDVQFVLSECAEDCGCNDEVDVLTDENGQDYIEEHDENTGESYRVYVDWADDIEEDDEEVYESLHEAKGRRIVYRVNARGKKTKKLRCGPGRVIKTVGSSKQCVVPTGRQKLVKRMAVRKELRTKKQKGAGYQRKVQRKRLRAMRYRKAQGLKNAS